MQYFARYFLESDDRGRFSAEDLFEAHTDNEAWALVARPERGNTRLFREIPLQTNNELYRLYYEYGRYSVQGGVGDVRTEYGEHEFRATSDKEAVQKANKHKEHLVRVGGGTRYHGFVLVKVVQEEKTERLPFGEEPSTGTVVV